MLSSAISTPASYNTSTAVVTAFWSAIILFESTHERGGSKKNGQTCINACGVHMSTDMATFGHNPILSTKTRVEVIKH